MWIVKLWAFYMNYGHFLFCWCISFSFILRGVKALEPLLWYTWKYYTLKNKIFLIRWNIAISYPLQPFWRYSFLCSPGKVNDDKQWCHNMFSHGLTLTFDLYLAKNQGQMYNRSVERILTDGCYHIYIYVFPVDAWRQNKKCGWLYAMYVGRDLPHTKQSLVSKVKCHPYNLPFK